jgi:RNA polymerase sigma-70 factor, ECF subfamily
VETVLRDDRTTREVTGPVTGEEATRRFYDLVWPMLATVLRTARILTGNDADAEDLAQETLLKAFKAIGQFREGTDVRAWLLAILRNARVDRLRSAAASAATVSLDALDLDPPDRPGQETEDWQAITEDPERVLNDFSDAEVIDALQHLPEEIRWTMLLVMVEGMDQAEAAGVLGVPVGTVKSRLHRGRTMLRQALLPLARERRVMRD